MSLEKLPINEYEDEPGKLESKPTDLPNPVSSNSANDNLQTGLQSLRGQYGQGSAPVTDPPPKKNNRDFKEEQLQGRYGQNTDARNIPDATHERENMGESKY